MNGTSFLCQIREILLTGSFILFFCVPYIVVKSTTKSKTKLIPCTDKDEAMKMRQSGYETGNLIKRNFENCPFSGKEILIYLRDTKFFVILANFNLYKVIKCIALSLRKLISGCDFIFKCIKPMNSAFYTWLKSLNQMN